MSTSHTHTHIAHTKDTAIKMMCDVLCWIPIKCVASRVKKKPPRNDQQMFGADIYLCDKAIATVWTTARLLSSTFNRNISNLPRLSHSAHISCHSISDTPRHADQHIWWMIWCFYDAIDTKSAIRTNHIIIIMKYTSIVWRRSVDSRSFCCITMWGTHVLGAGSPHVDGEHRRDK